jgi:predicted methyltransferase MtxX (methanogen marker protein 4)
MDTYTYVPVSFLEVAFGAKVRSDGRTAYVAAGDGRRICFADNNLGVMMDGRIYDLGREAKTVDGVLFVPVEWYASVSWKGASAKKTTPSISGHPRRPYKRHGEYYQEILG